MPITARILTIQGIETAKKKIQPNYDFIQRQLDAIPGAIDDLENNRNIAQYITIKPEYSPARIESLRKTRIKSLGTEERKHRKQLAAYQVRLDNLDKRLEIIKKLSIKREGNSVVDKEVNKRFLYFRKKYIDERQDFASDKMNLKQTTLSNLETYKRNVSKNIIEALRTKYNCNIDWLLSGNGDPTKDTEAPSTIRKSMLQMQLDLQAAETRIKVLEANVNRLYEIVDGLTRKG